MNSRADLQLATAPAARRAGTGFSLVEVLVALGLGAFLTLAAAGVFLAGRKTAVLEDARARLQDNARVALDLLRQDLHRAGYLGCNTGEVLFIDMLDNRGTPGAATAFHALRGYERLGSGAWAATPPVLAELHWSRAVDSAAAGGARPGSDVLRLRTARRLEGATPGGLLRQPVVAGDEGLSLTANPGCAIRRQSHVVVADCGPSAHLFQVSNDPPCAGSAVTLLAGAPNVLSAINASYGLDAEVLLASEIAWFVGDTGRVRRGMTVWGLFRDVRGDGRGAQEVVDGIEHMQIQFRVRKRSAAAMQVAGPAAALEGADSGDTIVAVSIGLLLQGFDLTRDSVDERHYRVLDEGVVPAGTAPSGQGAVHASGQVLRDVFTMTVAHRNAAAS